MHKLIRITTVPLSLEKLLEGQLSFMSSYFDVTAISADKSRLDKFGKDNGVTTYHIELTRKITPLADLKSLYKLYIYIKKEKPLIVHSHTPKAGIVAMTAAYFARVPLRLHTVAGLPLMESTGLKRIVLNTVEKWTYRFATKVYPNSKGLYNFILKEKFTQKNKLKVIGNGSSNGIDTHYFNPAHYSLTQIENLKKDIEISPQDFVFIFVGRIVGDKGINELIQAFETVNNNYPLTTLLLVGPFENDLDPLNEETISAINKNSKIKTVGYQKDVRPYFALSDVLVFPSYREGFPNVVMQAGAMNLPCIVSNINGCNEIIEDGANGIIIPPKDTIHLIKAMTNMLVDKSLYISLKNQARQSVVTKYERMEIMELLLKEYQELKALI